MIPWGRKKVKREATSLHGSVKVQCSSVLLHCTLHSHVVGKETQELWQRRQTHTTLGDEEERVVSRIWANPRMWAHPHFPFNQGNRRRPDGLPERSSITGSLVALK